MMSRKAIKEFKKIWKKEFNEEISNGEAEEKGMGLLQLFKLIYKSLPKQKK